MGKYIREVLDPALREPVQRQCDHVLVRLGDVDRTAWYPLQDAIDMYKAIYDQYDDPQKGFDALWRAGHHVASDAAGTFLKLLLKVLTPKLFARQFPEIWRRYHDWGELRADLGDLEQNKVYFTMPGYPYVPPVTAGWLEYLFLGFGMKDVNVDVKVSPAGPWPDQVDFEVSWSGS
jgi:hypothetical protein